MSMKRDSKQFEILKRATEELPPIPNLSDSVGCDKGTIIEYEPVKGVAIGFGLYNNKSEKHSVAVMRVIMSAGTIYPEHVHEEKEYGIVFKGHMKITMNGTTQDIYKGDMVYIPSNVPHIAETPVDSEIIFITIPSGKGYPDA